MRLGDGATTALGIALVVCLAGDARADALRDHRKAVRVAAKAEKAFWDAYRERQRKADEQWFRPWLTRRVDTKNAGLAPTRYVDVAAYRVLFKDGVDVRLAYVAAAEDLVSSGDERALDLLVDLLTDLADEIDETDASFAKVNPSGGWGGRDQRASVRRHALAAQLDALQGLLARTPGMTARLIGWYPRAEKLDGKRSIVRRVAVLDVLGRAANDEGDAFLRERLGDTPTFVRIAALQALVRPGVTSGEDVRALLSDPSPVVRRALLSEIARDGRDDVAWVLYVHAAFGRSAAQERWECAVALDALTGAGLGDDAEGWGTFVEEHADAIFAGTLVRSEATSTADAPTPRGTSFYDVPSASRAIVFVLDNTTFQHTPAVVEVQRTRWYGDWGFGVQGWEDEHASHRTVQRREIGRAVEELGDEARFGAVMNKETAAVVALGERKLLPGGKRSAKKAREFLDENPPRAFRAELSNLEDALRIGGLDPAELPDVEGTPIDSVMMVCDGSLRGGHYIVPEAAIAAFTRLNRFRRVVVHTIRICDAGAESERLLRGIAEASGGTYRWATTPP